MSTLIGDGSHAVDIAHTYAFEKNVPHHSLFVDDGDRVVIGVNDPQTRAQVSWVIGVRDSAWVHPRSWIGPECEYGYGTHINYGVTMTRTRIGRHCTISPGVTICGDVTIGHRVLVGAGSVISDRVTIGDDAIIGAGAVVLPQSDVPAGATWVGVPARQL